MKRLMLLCALMVMAVLYPSTGHAKKVYYDNSSTNWSTVYVHYWGGTGEGTSWTDASHGKPMTRRGDTNIWETDVDINCAGMCFNNNSNDQTEDINIAYDYFLNNDIMFWGYYEEGKAKKQERSHPVTFNPNELYISGCVDASNAGYTEIGTGGGLKMTETDVENVFKAENVKLINATGDSFAFFTLTTAPGVWDYVNLFERYGATSNNESLASGETKNVWMHAGDTWNSSNSWKLTPGYYDVTVDLNTQKISVNRIPDLYIIGNIENVGWTPNSNNPMDIEIVDSDNIIYRFAGIFNNDAPTFAVSTTLGSSDTDWGSYGNSGFNKGRLQISGASNLLNDGATETLTGCTDGNTNIKLSGRGHWIIEVNYNKSTDTFSTIKAFKIDQHIYILGGGLDGIGWNPATEVEFTFDNATKTFSYTGLFSGDHNFAISSTRSASSSSWDGFNGSRYKLGKGTYLEDGVAAELVSSGSDWDTSINVPAPGFWTLTLSYDNGVRKLKATRAKLYATGSFENNWIPNTEYQFAYDAATNTMKFTTLFYDEHRFIISTTRGAEAGDWAGINVGRMQLKNDNGENNNLTEGVAANLAKNTDGSANIGLPMGGLVTLTATYDNVGQRFATIRADRFSDNLYITGDFGSGWIPNADRMMTFDPKTENYTFTADFGGITADEGGKLAFAISTTVGSDGEDWSGLNTGRLKLSEGRDLVAGIPANLAFCNDGNTNIKLPKSGLWKITVNRDHTVITATQLDVNMPLTRSDFAGGKAHYFLVGSRTSDWRLQPEWEFKAQGDGSYRIPDGRFMYTGMIGIGKVTTYDDYVHQRFELFVNPGQYFQKSESDDWSTLELSELNLQSQGKRQAYVDYGDVVFNRNNVMVFYAGNNRIDDESAEKGSNLSRESKGVFVGNIQLNLDGGNPKEIRFGDISETNPSEFVFQLVGGNIYNERLDFENLKSPLNTPQHIEGHSWGDAWLQYDDNGNVYHDATGRYIYQTVYQDSWFTKHPTYFYRASDDLAYTSKSITFVNVNSIDNVESDPYYEFYHSRDVLKQIGGHLTESDKFHWNDGETDYDFNEYIKDDKGNDISRTPGAGGDWQCFVVKDIWIKGDFKVWSGFGGGCVAYEFDNGANNTRSDARWNRENGGGSAIENRKYTVEGFDVTSNSPVTVYAAYKDVIAADFRIGDGETLTFFNRMILWYNPNDGMNNAVLQLITEINSPQIIAKNVKEGDVIDNHKISYEWSLSEYANSNKDRNVSGYVINRYRVTPEGTEFNGVVENVSLPEGTTVRSFFDADNDDLCDVKTFVDDNNTMGLAPGTYMYEVILTFTDETGKVSKQAMSNQITLYSPDNYIHPEPVAIQLLLLRDAGEEYFIKDASTLAQYRQSDTYLTYRTSGDANYYLINPTVDGSNNTTGIMITQVNSADARNFINNNFADYLWTSDFYVRALDLTSYYKRMNDYIDRGIISLTEPGAPQLTVNDVPTFTSRVQYLDNSVDEQDYVVTIIHRNGSLEADKFTADMRYRFKGDTDDDENMRPTSGSTESQPVKPKAWGGSYEYVLPPLRDEHDEIVTDDDGNVVYDIQPDINLRSDPYNYSPTLLFEVQSAVDPTKMVPVYMKTEELNPRKLDVIFKFNRPNITPEIVHFYDVLYDIDVTTNFGDSNSLLASGIYYDEQSDAVEDINYDANYTIRVKGVHPSAAYYPTLKVNNVRYEYHIDDAVPQNVGFDATFGRNISIEAKTATERKPGEIIGLNINYSVSSEKQSYADDPIAALNAGWKDYVTQPGFTTDGVSWMYFGHKEFRDPGDVLVKGAGDQTQIDIINLTSNRPHYYLIETAVVDNNGQVVDGDHASYAYLVKHDVKIKEIAPDGTVTRVEHAEDPLEHTWIAHNFSSTEKPTVFVTPVYIFNRIGEGVGTELMDDSHSSVELPLKKLVEKGGVAHRAPGMRRASSIVSKLDTSKYDVKIAGDDQPDVTDFTQDGPYYGDLTASTGGSSSAKPAGTLTGVEGVAVDRIIDGEVEYYNLQGMRIMNPRKGEIYVVRSANGSKVMKL